MNNVNSALAVPNRAFGGVPSPGYVPLTAFDALHPHHAPLPRAVGPYTVVRTTTRITVNSDANTKVFFFGTYRGTTDQASKTRKWSNIVVKYNQGLSSVAMNNTGAGNTAFNQVTPVPISVTDGNASVVPAAFSVQVVCSSPLNTAPGVIYAGRMKTSMAGTNAATWDQEASRLISFMAPRMLPCSKLALQGVQIDAIPFDMAELADFAPVTNDIDTAAVWADGNAPLFENAVPTGFAPIYVIVPENSANIEFLVTTEWRVRFDLTNPASASHTFHGVSHDTHWANAIHQMHQHGHGVREIATRVANYGARAVTSAARTALPILGRAALGVAQAGLPALMA